MKIMDVSYVDQAALEAAETCIFKGAFYDKEQWKVGTVILPDTFFMLHQDLGCKEVFEIIKDTRQVREHQRYLKAREYINRTTSTK